MVVFHSSVEWTDGRLKSGSSPARTWQSQWISKFPDWVSRCRWVFGSPFANQWSEFWEHIIICWSHACLVWILKTMDFCEHHGIPIKMDQKLRDPHSCWPTPPWVSYLVVFPTQGAGMLLLFVSLAGSSVGVRFGSLGTPWYPHFWGRTWTYHPHIMKLQTASHFRFFLIKNSVTFFNISINNLVGGFKHEFYFPFHIWDVILPIDEVHHFSRWLASTTNQ